MASVMHLSPTCKDLSPGAHDRLSHAMQVRVHALDHAALQVVREEPNLPAGLHEAVPAWLQESKGANTSNRHVLSGLSKG